MRTKSPPPYSPLRTGATEFFGFFYFPHCQKSLVVVLLSSRDFLTSLSQVHLLLWWFAVRYHQNEQQPPVPPPDPHSITTKLPSWRRSVQCKPKFYSSLWCNKEKVRDNKAVVLFCLFVFFSISFWICRFLPFPENLPVSAAGLHLRCLVSTFVASRPATPLCVQALFLPLSCWQMLSMQCLCLGVGWSVLTLNVMLFTTVLINWDMFWLVLCMFWACVAVFFFFFFHSVGLCVQWSTELQGKKAVHDYGACTFIKRGHYGKKELPLNSMPLTGNLPWSPLHTQYITVITATPQLFLYLNPEVKVFYF